MDYIALAFGAAAVEAKRVDHWAFDRFDHISLGQVFKAIDTA